MQEKYSTQREWKIDGTRIYASQSQDPMTRSFRNSVRFSIGEMQSRGIPIARYDAKQKKAYLEYPDGSRQYEQ